MGVSKTRLSMATALLCLAFAASSVWAQGVFPERNMPIGLGMPKPKDGPDPKTAFEKSRDLLSRENFQDAVPLLQAVVIDDPRNDDAWSDLAYASERLGRNAEAVGFYERALAIRPARKDTRVKLGALQLALDNLPKSEEQATELKRLCPEGCDELKKLETDIAAYKATPHIIKKEAVR